mmetsp:Transcript_51337/g.149310  ORF Transcript_51337/g.149310 Transcript_51337/m.149310 type:complete len:255 (-) Transcript_51337:830-1594(-)
MVRGDFCAAGAGAHHAHRPRARHCPGRFAARPRRRRGRQRLAQRRAAQRGRALRRRWRPMGCPERAVRGPGRYIARHAGAGRLFLGRGWRRRLRRQQLRRQQVRHRRLRRRPRLRRRRRHRRQRRRDHRLVRLQRLCVGQLQLGHAGDELRWFPDVRASHGRAGQQRPPAPLHHDDHPDGDHDGDDDDHDIRAARRVAVLVLLEPHDGRQLRGRAHQVPDQAQRQHLRLQRLRRYQHGAEAPRPARGPGGVHVV